jgi:protein ImuB
VLTATIGGGRVLAERQQLVPWGDRATGAAGAKQPWPGSLPAPAPATVFEARRTVGVFSSGGEPIRVDDRGTVTAQVALFSATGSIRDAREVSAWAGPWPILERWWDARQHRSIQRFQIVDADGTAWLLMLDGEEWSAEARYD